MALIRFKKLWHKIAATYSIITLVLFIIFNIMFKTSMVDYFQEEYSNEFKEVLNRYKILVDKEMEYQEIEESLKGYEIIVLDEEKNIVFGQRKLLPLVEGNNLKVKTRSDNSYISEIEDGDVDYEYWVFSIGHRGKDVYIVKDIQGRARLYENMVGKFTIFIMILAVTFVFLSFLISRMLLKPIYNIFSRCEKIDFESTVIEPLDDNYSEEEFSKIIKMNNRFIEKANKFVQREKSFISNASHEIKTPLTVIRGYNDILKWCKDDDELYNKAIYSIDIELDRVEELMRSLLILSSIEGYNYDRLVRVDLGDILEGLCRRLEKVYDRKIHYRGIPKGYIRGDIHLIETVFSEIIKNGVKYSSEPIEVTLDKRDEELEVSFRDRGDGIEDIEKIFNKFEQLDSSKSTKGFGLGLSIVKEICDIHRGEVLVESNNKNGTNILLKFKKEVFT